MIVSLGNQIGLVGADIVRPHGRQKRIRKFVRCYRRAGNTRPYDVILTLCAKR